MDTASLVSLITAQVFRLWAFVCHGRGEHFCGKVTDDPLETDELNEIYLAQYFQAVSAPFVLGKVLFLTQVGLSRLIVSNASKVVCAAVVITSLRAPRWRIAKYNK